MHHYQRFKGLDFIEIFTQQIETIDSIVANYLCHKILLENNYNIHQIEQVIETDQWDAKLCGSIENKFPINQLCSYFAS